MSESLRDRVARVLCDSMDDDGPKGPVCEACYQQADALIADGLVYGVGLNRERAEFFGASATRLGNASRSWAGHSLARPRSASSALSSW